ncbi:MAG: hypothetical protein H7Y10_02050 [Flavobacterium sp.]|nr:hypothetical protein [Flavobacterium sp.]
MKLSKLLIFCFLSVLFSVYGQVQEVFIKGKVVDENGLSILGASIFNGTTITTSSYKVRDFTTLDVCKNNSLWAFEDVMVDSGGFGFVNQSGI